MSVPVISRSTWTDDDGSGTTGTILNNTLLQDIYDRIDALHAKGARNIVSTAVNYTVATGDGPDAIIATDASGGARSIGLYTAVGNSSRVITVVKTDTSANIVTVDGNSTETIGAALTRDLYKKGDFIVMASDGTNWQIVSERVTIAFRAFRNTSTQNINTSTLTKVQLNGETDDTAGAFDSTTNFRFTVPTGGDGEYLFTGTCYISGAGSRSAVYLRKNGADFSSSWATMPAAGDFAINISERIPLVAGDFVELYGWHESGATQTIANGSILTWLSGIRLSAH